MGQISVQNGTISASGYANNKAAVDYVKANGTSPQALLAADAAGANTPLTPVTSPASVGGVTVPQQTGTSNPPIAATTINSTPASTATVLPSVGGTDSTSAFNIKPTSKSEQKLAQSATNQVQTVAVFPTVGFVAPPAQDALGKFMADWYRSGRPDDTNPGEFLTQRKMIDPFEETQASIRVFGRKNDKDVELVPGYTKFILEAVQESHSERSQIVETFGDFYVFLFGERPPMYNFTGTLINTRNVNWVADFKFYYDNYLRGSKCAELNARLLMTYGGRQIEGFMLGMTTMTDASVEVGVKVSFPVVVTRKTFLGFSDDFGFLTDNSGTTIKDADFRAMLDKIAGKDGKGTSNAATSQAAGAVGQIMAGEPAVGLLSATA